MAIWNSELIETAFADAALDSSLWVKALDIVVSLTESHGALLLPITGKAIPNVPFTERLGESIEAYFRDNWHLRDERDKGLPKMLRHGVFDDLDIVDVDKIERHPYYQEFLRPHDLQGFAGVRVACGEDLWCLSIQRTISQGHFSTTEKRRLAQLSDRLSASAVLARALGTAATEGALQAFEASGKAVVLINRRGEVFRVNSAAEQLLKGDVRIERKRIVANDTDATAALDKSLHALMWQRIGGGLSVPVPLPRRGKRPILAYPIKLANLAANAFADCQALIILIDLDQQAHLPEMVLRSTFGMTVAEARLAARMGAGESLEFATEQIGIAKDTGRNQLKNIFLKAGVKRQSELVAVLTPILKRAD
jgi:DNA-binding CsgD family transcriptional regulator